MKQSGSDYNQRESTFQEIVANKTVKLHSFGDFDRSGKVRRTCCLPSSVAPSVVIAVVAIIAIVSVVVRLGFLVQSRIDY